MNIDNQTVAQYLEEIGVLMRLAGENDFRAMAFDRAARTIEGLDDNITTYIENKTLTDIKGIGKSIANDLYALAETGRIPVLDELNERVPDGLKKWLNISGMGPKKIYKIHDKLGITEISELKEKCEDGSVAALSGMGKKSADKILKSIAWMEQFDERCRLDDAERIANVMLDSLKDLPGVQKIDVAGSYRRSAETIGDVDILIAAKAEDTPAIFDAFTEHETVVEILGRGDTKSSVRTKEGRQVDLRIVQKNQFAAALMYFTGSKEHNVAMRQRARDRGLALNEYGLFKLNDEGNTNFDEPIPYETEADIYKELGLNWVPPELREDRGEIAIFEEHEKLDLVTEKDIRGVIHAHSTWSDGKYSIEEMARACIEKGYEYLGITDHSKTAAYAGGLTIEKVEKQWAEIDTLNQKFKDEGINFQIFKGIESDILTDGSLDYPDEILAGFDFVIASVHSSLEMPKEKMMERFKKAISNPYTTMIGHPTGRLLLKRDGSALDMNQIIEWASEHDKVIEINASPWRLDLDWRHGNKARELGLKTSINPDAHSLDGIDDITYGTRIARKAKFEKERVVNTMSAEDFREWLGK